MWNFYQSALQETLQVRKDAKLTLYSDQISIFNRQNQNTNRDKLNTKTQTSIGNKNHLLLVVPASQTGPEEGEKGSLAGQRADEGP